MSQPAPFQAWDRLDVPALMNLEQLGEDLFRNRFNQRNFGPALFGGQILGQALAAASLTAGDRPVHSLHAYFLRAGAAASLINFAVERLRDSRNFTTRRVKAVQDGQDILVMTASFAVPQGGFDHQFAPSPAPPPPESLPTIGELIAALGDQAPPFVQHFAKARPIEIRPVAPLAMGGEPKQQFWFRAPSAAGTDDPVVHRNMLAYMSDYWLAGTALIPHALPFPGPHIFVASLDHALWFHRPMRVDEWLLYETDSPSARNGINLSRGLIFDRAGQLVASTAQEALQVPRRDKPTERTKTP
jgi:acyl-CoA thioesterase-2